MAELVCDVLVTGGGLAGCWAALRAADSGARVILAEQGRLAHCGKSTFAGAGISYPTSQDDLDLWAKEIVEQKEYLIDQDWVMAFLQEQESRMRDMEAWGAYFERDEHGQVVRFENARGERLVERYPQVDNERRFLNLGVDAFYQELKAGRGPIYLNLADHPDLEAARYPADNIRHSNRTHGYIRMMQRLGIDVTREKVEWTINRPNFGGSVRVDVNCQTTVPGLYAAAAAIILGSGIWGALSSGHLQGPLGFVVANAFKAGVAAAKAVSDAPKPVPTTEVEKLKTEIVAPLGVKEGYSPYDAITQVQELIFPLENSYLKHRQRLEKALDLIQELKARVPRLKARDAHELVRCHEARSMLLNAEVFFRAALERTETRGTNRREDYPERDDQNWLKWIIIKKEDGKMTLSTEPVPLDRYKFRPGGAPSREDPGWVSL
ncbi:MAG: FAD-dependent oxidoreductase [Chloroflexi bacterium]|nr:FAD-dependent oxidoreductase [Chloroflexota bacterium]